MVLASRTAVLVICICYAIGNIVWSASAWEIPDIEAYWNAALRLRDGGPLYPLATNVNDSEVYRYAPWFAYAWIPLGRLARTCWLSIGCQTGQTFAPRIDSGGRFRAEDAGWGGRIRTFGLLIQNQAPYRLATPQWMS